MSNYGTFKSLKKTWQEEPPKGNGKKKLNWLLDQMTYWEDNPPSNADTSNAEMVAYIEYKNQSTTYNIIMNRR